ncbi:MAG: CAP domain-containing protein [Polyangiaceae bacterium]|nr:CAP domain-containing protein [Polyangiaceae bacterium]
MRVTLGLLGVMGLLLSACSGSGSSGSGPGGSSSDPLAAERRACVDKINAYRDTLGLPHYALWAEAGACSDAEARADAKSGQAHGAFGNCGEHAQNECPGWPIESISAASGSCLDMMWAEGPGENFQEHGHFINMSSTKYTKVACGFSASSGSVWAVQNFK